ncbi:MAG: hypothetical protein KAT05_15540 [Spirochaetes bacterium]|nr:hypothetical protein [Spirochaetota bacterium]
MSYKGTKWLKNKKDWEISSSYDKPTPEEQNEIDNWKFLSEQVDSYPFN